MAAPLCVAKGQTTKIVLRGWNLADATEVRTSAAGVTLRVLNKGAAPPPDKQDAKLVGDAQIECEINIPGETPLAECPLIAVSPASASSPLVLLIDGATLLAEKEPNDGFRQAQPVSIPQVIQGQVQGNRDVDVFTWKLERPGRIVAECRAQRSGSGLDSLLTLFDERGQIVAVSDDDGNSSDSRIDVVAAAGTYYLGLQDAHDRGGPAHPYRLSITAGTGP